MTGGATIPVALGTTLLLAALGLPGRADAAACCMSATAYGVGRLMIWEDAAVGLQTRLGEGLGYWSHEGDWRSYGDTYAETELRLVAWGLVRVSERTNLYGRVPVIANWRSTPEEQSAGAGPGDVDLGLRYELLSIGEYVELPAVAFTFALLVPTGRPTHRSDAALSADVTGRGEFVGFFSVSLEKTFLPWFWRVDLGASLPSPTWQPQLEAWTWSGPGASISAAGGRELVTGLVTSLVLGVEYASASYRDGYRLAGSAAWTTTASAAVSWALTPQWTIQGSVGGAVPVAGLGRNRPGQLTGTLGLRWGHIR